MKNSKNLIDKKEQGKKNRKSGAAFELKVRKDLESKGWIVAKWPKNVELNFKDGEIDGEGLYITKLIDSKPKFNPFTKSLMMNSAGFPDFICHRLIIDETRKNTITIETTNQFTTKEDCDFRNRMRKPFEVIGVEAKSNGTLDKVEKEKCSWLLQENIFSKILIAKKEKIKNKINIRYIDFEEKYK